MLNVYEQIYSSRIAEKVGNLPVQDLIVLSAAVIFFSDRGEEKRLPLKQLYKEVEIELQDALERWSFKDKIDYNKFLHAIDELEFYGFFKVIKDKSNVSKGHELLLTVDLEELDRELEKKKDEKAQRENKMQQLPKLEKQQEQL